MIYGHLVNYPSYNFVIFPYLFWEEPLVSYEMTPMQPMLSHFHSLVAVDFYPSANIYTTVSNISHKKCAGLMLETKDRSVGSKCVMNCYICTLLYIHITSKCKHSGRAKLCTHTIASCNE